jgi:hypothetical protein
MNQNWHVGIARRDITPRENIALAGWGARRISEGITHPLWAKAVALQDAHGKLGVLVTTDLLGLSRDMSEDLSSRALKRFGLAREQIIINSSHNHAGPVTGDLLHLYYELSTPDLEVIARYTAQLLDEIESAIGEAIADLRPSTLSFEQGLCGFGVNRRRSRGEKSKALPQVVDQDVPVLCARDENQNLRAIVFGYACHPTSYAVPQLCGDWPGFAQIEIENQFPGACALFVAGCGGDINPIPRFGTYHEKLAQMYGEILAAAVANVLDEPMRPLEANLETSFEEIALPLQTPPDLEQLETMRETASAEHGAGIRLREVEQQIRFLKNGAQVKEAPYPIHVWKLGVLRLVALSGEPVVDYSLRFKAQYGFTNTWTAGYCNELTSYIPSLRVLREGGYEGTDGMLEYNWPSPFDESVEEKIAAAVENLISPTKEK